MKTYQEVLDKVKAKYPLPSLDESWKLLRQDDDFFESVMEAVESGSSVTTFARSLGLSPSRMGSWLSTLQDEEKVRRYNDARRTRAGQMADRILDVCEQIETGLISPSQGRVIVDNLKWLAARLDPHLWGDKLQVKAEVQTTTEMHLEAVRILSERVKAGDERPVIEGEVNRDRELLE